LDFLKKQIEESLSGLPKKNLLGLMIAYEPIWAIGKSYREAMTPTDIHEITLFIKKVAGELLGKDIANSFKILYGAAVEAENASDIMRIGNVEGFLVGHASLVADQFGTILKSADMRR
jgi:triosephosphate isomerase